MLRNLKVLTAPAPRDAPVFFALPFCLAGTGRYSLGNRTGNGKEGRFGLQHPLPIPRASHRAAKRGGVSKGQAL